MSNTSLFDLPKAFLFWTEHPNYSVVALTFHQNPLFPIDISQRSFKKTNQVHVEHTIDTSVQGVNEGIEGYGISL